MKPTEFEAQYTFEPFTYDPQQGHPSGKELFYQCLLRQDVLASQPGDNCGCSCGNLSFDVDYHRLAIREGTSSIRLLSAHRQLRRG